MTQSAPTGVTPLPTTIGGTSVSIDGLPAPLLFVSPAQINAQVPSAAGISAILTNATVIVTSAAGASARANVSVFPGAPAAFTLDSSGCGQAAAIDVTPDGASSLNSPANSAAPGDYLEIFGTGLGTLDQQPPDGTAPAGPDLAAGGAAFTLAGGADSVFFGANPSLSSFTNASYAGAAPTLVGVDQINFQIPAGTRNGCAVPMLLASAGALSTVVTVSINANRGACADPPQQSFGQVTLVKTIASDTANDGETDEFTATFPSAPGLIEPAPPVLTPGPGAIGDYRITANSRSCTVPGYTELSAGTIQIRTPGQNVISAQPQSQGSGVVYQTPLPAGYIGPATYSISSASSAAGSPVSFQGTITPGAPIAIQTSLAPGTVLSSSSPPITWTGGDANSVVRITLIGDVNEVEPLTNTSYVTATAGSVTLPVFVPSATNVAELIFEVLPAAGVAGAASAQGITGSIQLSWSYRYVFGGLSTQYDPNSGLPPTL